MPYDFKSIHKQICVIAILTMLVNTGILAQTEYLVGHIGLKDGLSSELCAHLLEDDKGNLWISTYQDVQKYDGNRVTVFPHKNSEGKKSEAITDLLKDAYGNIWIVQGEPILDSPSLNQTVFYTNCSVNVIDAATDSIYQLQDYLGPHNYGEIDIVKILPTETALYLCTSDYRLFKYEKSLELYSELKDIAELVSVTEEGDIVYLDKIGLKKSDKKLNSTLLLSSTNLAEYDGLVGSSQEEIFLIKEQADSISIFAYSKSEMHFITTLEKRLFDHLGPKYRKIERYGPNIIFIWNRLYERQADDSLVELKLGKTKRLLSEYVVSKSGLSYASTDLGIYILDTNRNRFRKMAVGKDGQNSVRAFYTDADFTLYRDDKEKVIAHSSKYNLDFLDRYDLGVLAHHHYKDPINEALIWTVGLLDDNFIRRIDLVNQTVEKMEMEPTPNDTPSHILRSGESKTLYVTSINRPYYFDEATSMFRFLELNCLSENLLTTHIIERKGEIWFAATGGIIQYDEVSKTCKVKKLFPNSVAYVIQFMHEDKSNPDFVWLGTRRGGLVKWDTNTDSIQIFNTENGLSNNDVHAIIEDNSDRLWVPTNKYLNAFDKKSEKFFHFTESDGLSHSEFNKFSFFYDNHKGEVYFGGLNGYNYFNPDSISTSHDNQVELKITDVIKLKRNGTKEGVYVESLTANPISISEEDVSVEIELATNYLLSPDETRYSYRIPGLIDEWRDAPSNVISLNRLPYGEYTLECIADVNKFSSMSGVLSFDLIVEVPWWKTYAFYLFSLLGAIGLVGLIVQRYSKSIVDRNIKLEEMISLRTEELQEVIKTKNKIFTILAHDLRNPISGLSNLSHKVRFLLSKNRLSDLDQIAVETENRVKALNDNLNNILLWALSENNTLTIRPRSVSLGEEIQKVLQLYAHEVENKSLAISVDLKVDDRVSLDLTILQALLRNFIHNAIKFSYDKGVIGIVLIDKCQGKLELRIEDSGIGMAPIVPEEEGEIEKDLRNKGTGTGLGMEISKELASKAGLKFEVEASKTGGTTVLLILPKP